MNKFVNKMNNGVKISFTGEVKKQNIVTMVENCSTGKCECMSDETKKKIEGMTVTGKDGEVELELNGDISKEEIEQSVKLVKL